MDAARDAVTACAPGQEICSEGFSQICLPNGRSFKQLACNDRTGSSCTTAGCRGPCSPSVLGKTHVGCEFFATVTMNPVWNGFKFGVAVVSTTTDDANITILRGQNIVQERVVRAGATEVIELDWVAELKDMDWSPPGMTSVGRPGPTRLVGAAAYRLLSTRPVAVYQLNPLATTLPDTNPACPTGAVGRCASFSNDGSMLLPATALETDYVALSWPAAGNPPSTLAITAVNDDTTVELIAPGDLGPTDPDTSPVRPGGGVDGRGNATVLMHQGDVLQLVSERGPLPSSGAPVWGPDLSGIRVRASKPVQVIGGHACATVPDTSSNYCNHLEETIPPLSSLGTEYIVANFAQATAMSTPSYTLRVRMGQSPSTVTFEPAIRAPTQLDAEHPSIDVHDVQGDVRVTATSPVLAAQYITGGSATDPAPTNPKSDPSMLMAVPVSHYYRTEYAFFASRLFDSNFINVIAPSGATVTLDGTDVLATAFTQLAGSAWKVARLPLSRIERHTVRASERIGVVVYGYGPQTSYAYPAGVDFR